MFMSDWISLMTPQKATLDSMRILVLSYQRLSPQFQFSLSAVTLGIYLYDSHSSIEGGGHLSERNLLVRTGQRGRELTYRSCHLQMGTFVHASGYRNF